MPRLLLFIVLLKLMKSERNSSQKIKRDEKLSLEALVAGLRARIKLGRSLTDRIADFLTASFGTVAFLLLNAIFFFVWITINLGFFGVQPFDPYPFGLLTMIVSLEAIFLAVIVLITQNRQSHLADIRQKMDFEIDVRSEEEVTKILTMLDEIRVHLGVRHKHDKDLERMKQVIDVSTLQKEIEGRGE